MTQPNPLQIGYEHHRAGRLREAEAIYRAALARDADNGAANFLLGVVVHQSGDLPGALALLDKAARLLPAELDVLNYLSLALRDAGRLDEAADAARRAAALKPASAEAQVNLGIALHLGGDLAGAAAAYERAITLAPDLAPAHNNLGLVLQASGQFDAAERAYRRGIACSAGTPTAAESYCNLASVLQDLERPDDAVDAGRAAIALRENYPEAHNNLGNALRERGEVAVAIRSFRRAIELRPNYAKAHSNYLFALHFDPASDAAAIRAAHEHWAAAQADPLTLAAPPIDVRDRSPDRRLRVGYVSPDFREHPVGRFLLPIVGRHDRTRFEIVCYSDVRAADQVTHAVRARADRFVETAALNDAQLAERVRADEVDVLVDLALHSARNRLLTFARRAAPVQATYLGYAGTSGMRAMDYRLTDPYLDPAGEGATAGASDAAYTERSLRLPHTYWCYVPPPNMPDVAPPPAARNGYVTFGCLNKFTKVSDAAVRAWARVMARTPTSRLIVHAPPGHARQRVLAMLAEENVAGDRVRFVGRQPALEYLETYHRIDVGLDPFPYNGGTTTCDALLMGVPVVTLAGDVAVRRAGASVLTNAGLPELIARTPDTYVEIAAALAADLPRLATLRAQMRGRMTTSPLTDLAAFVRDLELAYRTMWQETMG